MIRYLLLHRFTAAIQASKTTKQNRLAHLGRSLANLQLGRLDEALEDASKSNRSEKTGNSSSKGFLLEAKILYALGRYEQCLVTLQAAIGLNISNKEVRSEINKVKERLREKKTGAYKFNEMYNQAKATPPIIDCATYIGPVAVRASPGRGRGLFTTKPVEVGEMLLCEKAFAYCYVGDDSPIGRQDRVLVYPSTEMAIAGASPYLIPQSAQKLYHNPGSSRVFKDLYHGDYCPVSRSEVDGKPIVDTWVYILSTGIKTY